MLTPIPQNQYILSGQRLFMFGFNPNVTIAGVPQDVWSQAGRVAFPNVADVVTIVSDSADDNPAGIGAIAVGLLGVDANFDTISEGVVLNGLTPVTTVQEFLFVNGTSVQAAGTNNVNVGNITYTIGVDLCNGIAPLKGQSQTCAAILPKPTVFGTEPHLISVSAMVGKQPSALGTLVLSRQQPQNNVILQSFEVPISANGGQFTFEVKIPIPFDPGEKLVLTVEDISSNNSLVTGLLQFSWLPPPMAS
jgi:hypothetical protein